MMENKIKVIAVVGPTASGKSSLAVALAERLNGELWLFGEFAVDIARGAVLGGFPVKKIHLMRSREECAEAIRARRGREIVLIKGSHACELWRIAEAVKEGRCAE